MTPVRRIAVGVAAALAVMLVPAHAGSAAAGDPDYHKPTVGDCHDYTFDEMYADSDTTPTVPCTDKHTGKVILVPMLPDDIDWSQIDKVYDFMGTQCTPAAYQWLGSSPLTRMLTAYNQSWYIPTEDERALGARWVRCDLFLWRGRHLSPLPYDAPPFVPDPLTAKVRLCLTGKLYATTCDAAHAWKATFAFNVRKGAYPSERQMARIAVRKCAGHVKPGRFRYDPPTKPQWKAGHRGMVCLSKTTS